MSFRDNLQHLRGTRNMTQSELAMLVGVSRQSVAKWEAEKSYPEMDKLIKLCDLFECTIDDLVRGDLTGSAPDPKRALPEGAPPVDACGYDEHMRRRAWEVPAGIALFIAGFGVAAVVTSLNASNPGALPYVAYFACAAVGLCVLARSFAAQWSFRRQHPYIEDFYTGDQRAAARREAKRCVAGGLALACLTLVLINPGMIAVVDVANLWGPVMSINWMAPFLLAVSLATSAALILHAVMTVRRTNIARYNRSCERRAEDASQLVAAMEARLTPPNPKELEEG
ncbi:helix-turn-helix transcriptional regulator [Gordonibacter massiliensis (ex Traore et al. 2017)]|uniref:Helix-turn-helix transcriptional regulator n=1 Tax=Gordonibacter massiliensis (ex Traore et al. 2017) TaxID=1841863 RepID=A0A842JFM4_9ACTN|nr:helix-turn-helix transcriptional regulator [Gordonibacter massiliensis (ex Traore et al. 2017)]MBC2890457.1 helix-turn-helix transcriptional regulator [Gordonibacter massiliensis (ex Traore et al. 2017)]